MTNTNKRTSSGMGRKAARKAKQQGLDQSYANASDLMMISPCEMYMRLPKSDSPQPYLPAPGKARRPSCVSRQPRSIAALSPLLRSSGIPSRTRAATKNRTFMSSPHDLPIGWSRLADIDPRSSTLRRMMWGPLRLQDCRRIHPQPAGSEESAEPFPNSIFTIRKLRGQIDNERRRGPSTPGESRYYMRAARHANVALALEGNSTKAFGKHAVHFPPKKQMTYDEYMYKKEFEKNGNGSDANITSTGSQSPAREQKKIVLDITFNMKTCAGMLEQEGVFGEC